MTTRSSIKGAGPHPRDVAPTTTPRSSQHEAAPIVFYISGHGFGHAARAIEVINVLGQLRPDVPVCVRTSAPRRLFDLTLRRPVEFFDLECDTGIVQQDSLHLDEAASIRKAAEFHRTLAGRVGQEAAFLRSYGARIVVGDIPPLASAAAFTAEVPSILIGNFTWDWIYEGYPELLTPAPDLVATIRRAYSTASRALRLPMSGGFSGLATVTRDIPFVARRSMRDPAEVRKALGVPPDKPLVLVSFGGYGVAGLDSTRLSALADYTFATTDAPSRDGWTKPVELKGLVSLSEQTLYDAGYRYEDLVRASDVVVTKPGYGIIAEAIANDTAMLYTSRGRFVEYDVLVAEMRRYLRAEYIEQSDLLAGRWKEGLDRLLRAPKPTATADISGDRVAAEASLELYET
jgi:L-arabinokinase